MNADGRLMDKIEAFSPDGRHCLRLEEGTRMVDADDKVVTLIKITRPAQTPELPPHAVAVAGAFDFTPSGTVFDKSVRLTLGYDVHTLPAQVASLVLARYSPEAGWQELESEGGTVAALGSLSAPVDHFTFYALLATPAGAGVSAANLAVTPLQDKGWRIIFPLTHTGREVVIEAEFTNSGGQSGLFDAILKVDGEVKDHQLLVLGPNETKTVTFRLNGIVPGNHTVELANLSGEFTTSYRVNWWVIAVLVVILIALGWLFKK